MAPSIVVEAFKVHHTWNFPVPDGRWELEGQWSLFPGEDTETAGSMTIKELVLDRLVNGVLGNTWSWATITPSFPLLWALRRVLLVKTEGTITKGPPEVLTSCCPPFSPFRNLAGGGRLFCWQNQGKPAKPVVLSVIPRPATSASPGSLLEMQIGRPHPRPVESETLGWGPAICVLTSLLSDSDRPSSLKAVTINWSMPGIPSCWDSSHTGFAFYPD